MGSSHSLGRLKTVQGYVMFPDIGKQEVMKDDILPSQVRAARSLIGWSREDLAAATGTTVRTLARFEADEGVEARPSTLASIRSALERAGIEFIPENGGGAGVRLKKS